MKSVLITQRLVSVEGTTEVRDALDVDWARFLADVGVLAVPVPSAAPLDALLEAVRPSGLILSGGNDLSTVSNDPLSLRRDELENRLCDWAEATNTPVIGVCRGLQVLAVRHGLRVQAIEGHVRSRHALAVDPASRWFAAHDGIAVNSYHRWAPAGNAPAVLVAARAADGTIEALEHRERPVLGIGWHPEREASWNSADVALFRAVFR